MKAIFDHSNQETPNIRTFWFRPGWPTNYKAGQYTELTLPIEHPDERGAKHWFTLSGTPGHDLVSITTKYAGDDKTSAFKRFMFHDLKPGDAVDLAEPEGDFVLPEDTSVPLVFVAGGIGLTPFHSMAGWLAERGQKRNITFLYGVRNEAEVVFEDTFRKAGIEPIVMLSEPTASWQGKSGKLSAQVILELTKPSPNALIYISGPEPMVEALEAEMRQAGIEELRLIGDFFPGYPAP